MAKPIMIGAAGGEYMDSVVVLEWVHKIGDRVKAGDLLVTVETAKAATEITAPSDGILSAIFVSPGQEIPLTEVLGLIGSNVDDTESEDAADADSNPIVANVHSNNQQSSPTNAVSHNVKDRAAASPAARRLAAQTGTDVSQVKPSSPTGRVKLRDLIELAKPTATPTDQEGPLKVYRSGIKAGIPVVLLHGFGSDATSWHPIERELAKYHPIIRIDLPNHGQSPLRRMQDFRRLAMEVEQAVVSLDEPRIHLVGHSLGGACALALAAAKSEHISSLCLIASGGLGPEMHESFAEHMALAATPAALTPWLKIMVADEALITPEFAGAAMSSRSDSALRSAQWQMARDLFPGGTQSFDTRETLSKLTCALRVIWGKQDRVIPWKHAAAAPGLAAIHLLDGVGHVPQLERPDQVLAILRRHIAEP